MLDGQVFIISYWKSTLYYFKLDYQVFIVPNCIIMLLLLFQVISQLFNIPSWIIKS